jgi:hypothetical protein
MGFIDVVLRVRNAQFLTGLQQAKGAVTRFGGDMRGMFLGFAGFTGIAAMLGAAAEKYDRIAKLSKQTGLGTDLLQVISANADLAGADLEMVTRAVARLLSKLQFADSNETGVGKALKQIGISVSELKGRSPEEVFDRIARAIGGIEDPTQRVAAATALFGMRGKELIPFFEQAAQGMEGVSIVSADTIRQIEGFNDSFERIKTASIAALAPVLAVLYRIGVAAKTVIVPAFHGAQNAAELLFASIFALGEAGKALVGKSDWKTVGDMLKNAADRYADRSIEIAAEAMRLQQEGAAALAAAAAPPSGSNGSARRTGADAEEDAGGAAARVPLAERLADIEKDAARKRLSTEEQIAALMREENDLRARLAETRDPDDRKKIEDGIVAATKERVALEERNNEQIDRRIQERQDRDLSDFNRVRDLKQQNAEREADLKLQSLTGPEREAFIAEQKRLLDEQIAAQTKAVEMLSNAVTDASSLSDQAKVEEEKGRLLDLEEKRSRLDEAPREQVQVFDSLRQIGLSLAGVNYAGANGEARRQTELQRTMVGHLGTIADNTGKGAGVPFAEFGG